MALTVATNTGALMAQAAASSVNKDMELSMERLSTGKRINGASDDAAGVAIASRLTSEIKGTNQAIRNAMDGQALIDTAEGAHAEVENILQRMRELAVQASNDTNDASDRTNLQLELDQLVAEIDRISAATKWAGQDLLNGGGGNSKSFNLQIGASAVNTVDNLSVTVKTLSSSNTQIMANSDGSQTIADLKSTATSGTVPAFTIAYKEADGTAASNNDDVITDSNSDNKPDDGIIQITDDDSATTTLDHAIITFNAGASDAYNVTVDLSSADTVGKVATAISTAFSNANPNLTVDTSDLAAGKFTISGPGSTSGGGLVNATNARAAIDTIDNAIQNLNNQRAQLGSYSNRLDSTVSNLTNISSNLQAGRGRIEDADFAAETTSLAKSQILQQASTAMLAQANASKQNVLSLLQG